MVVVSSYHSPFCKAGSASLQRDGGQAGSPTKTFNEEGGAQINEKASLTSLK